MRAAINENILQKYRAPIQSNSRIKKKTDLQHIQLLDCKKNESNNSRLRSRRLLITGWVSETVLLTLPSNAAW